MTYLGGLLHGLDPERRLAVLKVERDKAMRFRMKDGRVRLFVFTTLLYLLIINQ